MRIFCSICKEIFIPYSEILATNCGHLYHGSCISRWCKQHKTCPQCRTKLESQLIRIYFDVDKDNEIDASTLEHQLETVTNELRSSEIKNKNLKEENDKYEKILSDMEECTTALKRKNALLKSSVQALKNQITACSKQSETINELKNDMELLEKKLCLLKSVELVINSTSREADKVLKSTPLTEFGIKQLSIYASALKDKTEKDKLKLAQLAIEKKELQKALAEEQVKKSNVSEEEFKNLKAAYNLLEKELNIMKNLSKQHSERRTVKDAAHINSSQTRSQGRFQESLKRPMFSISFDFSENKEENIPRRFSASEISNSLKHWEDLVAAGPSRHLGLPINSSNLHSKPSNNNTADSKTESSTINYAFDGMGGRKKMCLGHPTPQNEFNKIKKIEGKKSLKMSKHKKIFDFSQFQQEWKN